MHRHFQSGIRPLLVTVLCSLPAPALAGDCLYVRPDPDPRDGQLQAACMQAGKNFPLRTATDLPADLSGVDILILGLGGCAPPHWGDRIQGFLEAGGGVLSLGATPFYLACSTDLSSISEWFGAARYVNTGGQVLVTQNAPRLGLSRADVVLSSANASDPQFRCAAAAVTDLLPGAIQFERWVNDPTVPISCGQNPATGGFAFGGVGCHVYLADSWQYSILNGVMKALSFGAGHVH